VRVLIPSIDLMDGKIVQLVQGRKKALEFDNFEEWIERFSNFPLVQLIDLDAAIGTGTNYALLQQFLDRLPCQVGGGIRSIETARQILGMGARRVILGSTLILDGKINVSFAEDISSSVGSDRLVFAIDTKGGRVAIRGWRELTTILPFDMITALDSYCHAFLYTHIETEGMMQGIPFEAVRPLRAATSKQLIVAGGISTNDEVERLQEMGVDAVVGMAVYTGKLNLENLGLRDATPTRMVNGLEVFNVPRGSQPITSKRVKELESE
jgi:phosphoribosylformimino-5-aminoimidazole carboxamide ribotide isomerase